MVFTRAQLDTLSREELIEELIKCSNMLKLIKLKPSPIGSMTLLANMRSCDQN